MRDDLPLLALRYAAGDLPPAEAVEFEARLATDAAAQDALAEAVRLSARALGQAPPAPDPLTRAAVRERLRPAVPVFARLFRRRPYRGHPLTWAGVGAGAAAGVLGVGTWLSDPERGPDPAPVVTAPRPAAPVVPDMNRTVVAPDAAPPVGGGGEAPAPPNPATTFLPPQFGPLDPAGL